MKKQTIVPVLMVIYRNSSMLAVGSASRDPGINKRKVSFSGKEDDEFSLQERYNKKCH